MTAQPSSTDTCPVCLRKLKRCDVLAQPESCGHQFCYICISEWAKNVNTCPVDRIKFNVINISCKDGTKSKVYVPDADLATKNDEDVTFCEVCHECTREDSLLLCDGCDKGYHLDCLVPPLSEIPEGNWYCPLCQPIVMNQVDMASPSQDECSMNMADETEARNVSAMSGIDRKPILINDDDDDDNDSDYAEDGDDSGDESSSGSISEAPESITIPRRSGRIRRIEDEDDGDGDGRVEDGGGSRRIEDSDSDDVSGGRINQVVETNVPVLLSPLLLSPGQNCVSETGDSRCMNTSNYSNHSSELVPPGSRARSSWRLVLSTSSSDNGTPSPSVCKGTPANATSDPFLSSPEKTYAASSSKSAPSLVRNSLLASTPAPVVYSPLTSNVSQSHGKILGDTRTDPFLSPLDMSQNCVAQHAQKDKWLEHVRRDCSDVGPDSATDAATSAAHVCDDPLTNVNGSRVHNNKPAAVCGAVTERQKAKKAAKRRRRVRRGVVRKDGKKAKKRRQALQFVSHHTSSCKSDEDDPSYVPVLKSSKFSLTPQGKIRTRARTAATHSPCGRNPAFTAAVMEAQRCLDSSDGLIKARAVLSRERGSVNYSAQQYSNKDSSPCKGGLSVKACTVQSEIARRMVPKRRLIQNVPSSSHLPPPALRPSLFPTPSATQEIDLVGTIFQKLDDLQSRHNVIKRDGTIVPIRDPDSSKPKPLQEGKGDRAVLFSEPEFSPNPSPLAVRGSTVRDDVLVCCGSSSHAWTSAVDSSVDVLARRGSWDEMRRHKHNSNLKKSSSSNAPLLSHESMMNHSPDSSTATVDCLTNNSFQTHSSSRQTRAESSSKHNSSRTDLSSPVSKEERVKQFVFAHFLNHKITGREYHRIVERATKKVQAGPHFDNARIKKLVDGYVDNYIKHREMLNS